MSREHITQALNAQIKAQGTEYKVFLTLSGKRRIGTVVKFNKRTTIVRVLIGASKSIVIKRHNVRHQLRSFWATKLRQVCQ